MPLLHAPDTRQRRIETPLGWLRLAATPRGLAGSWFEGQRHYPAPLLDGPGAWAAPARHTLLDVAEDQMTAYFAGERARFSLPLDVPGGTDFQRAVWQALRQVAHGSTCRYAALAAAIGRPSAVRAVAAAVGRNPISVVVPCHRVVGAGGALTGYAGGLERKAALLALEAAGA